MEKKEQISHRREATPSIPSFRESLKDSHTAQRWLKYVTEEIPKGNDSEVFMLRDGISEMLVEMSSSSETSREDILRELRGARFVVETSPGIQEITGETIYFPTFIFDRIEDYHRLSRILLMSDKMNPVFGSQTFLPAQEVQEKAGLAVSERQFPLGVLFRVSQVEKIRHDLDADQVQLHEQLHAVDLLGIFRAEVENGNLLSELIAYVGQHVLQAQGRITPIVFNYYEEWIGLIDNPRAEDLLAVVLNNSRILAALESGNERAAKEIIINGMEGMIGWLQRKLTTKQVTTLLLGCRTFAEVYQRAEPFLSFFNRDQMPKIQSNIRIQAGDLFKIGGEKA